MLLIPKPGPVKAGEAPQMRTVFDLWAQNANTVKRLSPLPDIDGILRRVACGRYCLILDGQDAYEQIRIVPEHVNHSAVTTPDGNMDHDVSMPVLVGKEDELSSLNSMEVSTKNAKPSLEKQIKTVRKSPRQCRKLQAAETGRPETSWEFASCMTQNFVLNGPGGQKEGGDIRDTGNKLTIRIPAKVLNKELAHQAADLSKIKEDEPVVLTEMLSRG
ncbi:hypothetical protein E4T56_gene20505 [Termitomyces sp. T112]|nr:hypothetical protein E4T56_gene20505 [Termitomyces sp. T112]